MISKKEKIACLLLIIISILGSRLIFGMDYHLNSDNLKGDKLYVYDNFDNKVVATYVDKEEFYYVTKVSNKKYAIIKYNLTSNKKENEYEFNSAKELDKVSLFRQKDYLYLILDNSAYYKFDKKLNVIKEDSINLDDVSLFGVYNDAIVYAKDNEIFYENKLYGEVPSSCGDSKEVIYNGNTYLHFYNEHTGFGCLYNLVNKKIEYLDYENAQYVQGRLLEYQSDRLSFKYDGVTYYFNDITESNNLDIDDTGDYLFTVDTTNNKLRIYNIESRKIIYEKSVPELKGATISNILVDDYIFFMITKDNKTSLYVWDYLKDNRCNYDMISYNEKEYKFKNNELKEEIKSKYNITVNIYDKAVDYFNNYYVVPSYDDILINSRLINLKNILESFDQEETPSISNIEIFFDKDIVSSVKEDKPASLVVKKNNQYLLAVNITNDGFNVILKEELTKIYPNLIKNIEVVD